MSKIDWRRTQHAGRQQSNTADEAERHGKDAAARWLNKNDRPPQNEMRPSGSKRLASLFSGATRNGGVYYSGKLQGEAFTIQPGQRLSLVKTSKTASNGAEIWSLLVDEAGTDDRERVYETRGHQDLEARRGQKVKASHSFERPTDDEIPF